MLPNAINQSMLFLIQNTPVVYYSH